MLRPDQISQEKQPICGLMDPVPAHGMTMGLLFFCFLKQLYSLQMKSSGSASVVRPVHPERGRQAAGLPGGGSAGER
jgi:hypothetical protein